MNRERFSLAELVDWLALDGPRDRGLVLRTVAWLHENAEHMLIEAAATAGLRDVAATLQIQEHVSWVVTGTRDDQPGEWHWKVAEADFPEVWLRLREEKMTDPTMFCALDLTPAGRPVLLPTGDRGTAVAAVLVAGSQQLRVRLPTGRVHTFPRDDVAFLDD